MDHNIKEDRKQVYEIGYLLVPSIPEEQVSSKVLELKDILSKKGAEFIGEEMPELRPLAYDMVKKIGSSNHKFEKGYFGWFKFEIQAGEINDIKKAFEENPDMLRMLLITTVKENTYLGKKSPVPTTEAPTEPSVETPVEVAVDDSTETSAPASIEEMDKSIDAMVKEA